MSFDAEANRRRFLQFLAASPLLAAGAGPALAETLLPKTKQPDPLTWGPLDPADLIKTPKEAINVFDFEPVCRQNVPPAHFGYMAAGIDDEATLRANRQDFQKFLLRPRRLVDVSKPSIKTDILGVTYDSPIFICPIGSNKAYNPDGEIAVAKAAKIGNHLQMLSTVATSSVEDVTAARGQPIVQQLYATNRWEVAQTIVKNAENAGALGVAVTVDRSGGRNQETLFRLRRTDTRQCSSCHDRTNMTTNYAHKPNIARANLTDLKSLQSSAMTWDFFKRLRDITKMKIIIKGILVPEDAAIAADNGIDAIIVSNHGGRADDAGLLDHRRAARHRRGREGPHADPGRLRLPPRHRRDQGAVHGRDRGRHRPALYLGPRRVRPGGRRARARAPAHRDPRDDAADGRADGQGPQARDGAAGVAP